MNNSATHCPIVSKFDMLMYHRSRNWCGEWLARRRAASSCNASQLPPSYNFFYRFGCLRTIKVLHFTM